MLNDESRSISVYCLALFKIILNSVLKLIRYRYDNVHYQPLKEQPDKYTVETINNNTSTLIIKNVQPTDPKVYTLCAYTDSVKKEIDVFLEVEGN